MSAAARAKRDSGFTLERWDEAQWHARRAQWTQLLQSSQACGLFMSWEWQTSWWRTYAQLLDAELVLLAVRDEQGALAALAPLYRADTRRRGLSVRSVQLIGNAFRDAVPVISEYLDFIVPSPCRDSAAARKVLTYVEAELDWNEFVAVCVRDDAALAHAIAQRDRKRGYLRRQDETRGYSMDLREGYQAYLQTLSASARRRLANMRARLGRHGNWQLRSWPPDELPRAFALLNEFHVRRWGRPLFEGTTLEFHMEVARAFTGTAALAVTALEIDARVVSIFYDYRIGTRQYNLQMGYDETLDSSLSLGLLHLGLVLEQCATAGTLDYDLLCGSGRRSDYKSRYATREVNAATLQLLRGKAGLIGRGFDAAAALRRSVARD